MGGINVPYRDAPVPGHPTITMTIDDAVVLLTVLRDVAQADIDPALVELVRRRTRWLEEKVAEPYADSLVEVQLLGLPPQLAMEGQEHFDELSREFLHLSMADESVRHDVPGRLLELSHALRRTFSAYVDENQRRIEEAAARGEAAIDLTYLVPGAAGAAAEGFGRLLEEADAYCAAGAHLLTLTTPPAPLAYRRWYISQFVDQIAGAAPVPFEEWTRHSM